MLRTQWIRADWHCSNCGNATVRDLCQGLLSFYLWHCSRFICYVQYPTIINNLRCINFAVWPLYFEFCSLSKRRLEFHTVIEEVYQIFSKTSFGWQPCQVVKWEMNQRFQNHVCSCCEEWFLKCWFTHRSTTWHGREKVLLNSLFININQLDARNFIISLFKKRGLN